MSASDVKAGRAFVEISANDKELLKGLSRAQNHLKEFGESVKTIGEPLAAIGDLVAGGLVETTRVFAEMGSELGKASQVTGIAAADLSRLKFAAQQSEVPFDALEGGLNRMQKALYSAGEGSKEAKEALATLGLTAEQLHSMLPHDQLLLISQRLSEVKNHTDQAGLAMALFGKSGAELIPLLGQGSQAIKDMEKRADDLGLTMSQADVEAAEEFTHAQNELFDAIKMVTVHIGAALAPTLSAWARNIASVAGEVGNLINTHRNLLVTLTGIAAVVGGVGTALVGVGLAFSIASKAIGVYSAIVKVAAILTNFFAASEEGATIATDAFRGGIKGVAGALAGLAAGVATIALIRAAMRDANADAGKMAKAITDAAKGAGMPGGGEGSTPGTPPGADFAALAEAKAGKEYMRSERQEWQNTWRAAVASWRQGREEANKKEREAITEKKKADEDARRSWKEDWENANRQRQADYQQGRREANERERQKLEAARKITRETRAESIGTFDSRALAGLIATGPRAGGPEERTASAAMAIQQKVGQVYDAVNDLNRFT